MTDGATLQLDGDELEVVIAALRLYLDAEEDPATVALLKRLLTRLGVPPEYPS
ncbi:MAG TPA: hypothetical protein VK592_08920 [Candidatus Dormibacteraeota bacterium]|jgi:hypothetical protein|nr:hypothetical protein [Candidatus Dormibacteraeota bacterium]